MEPELSIVIAASDARRTIRECLAALDPQTSGRDVETILAANPGDGSAEFVRAQFPRVTVVEADRPRLIPELWGLGAGRATGRVLAFTTAACIPDARWVEQVLCAYGEGHVATGGAIENARGASLVDWAVYFVRYTPYMLPFQAGPAAEVPGDNGTYQRAAIAPMLPEIVQRGFWDTEVNARLRAEKQTLWADPRIVVYHGKSFSFAGFTRQRFEHGRIFGRMRAARSGGKRAFYIATSPAIPFAYLLRIGRNVSRKKRHTREFALSFPFTLWFLLSWAAGEFAGLIGA